MYDPTILADDRFRQAGATVTHDGSVTNGTRLFDWRDDEQATHPFAGAWTTSVDLGVGVSGRAESIALVNHNLRSIGLTSVQCAVDVKDSPAGVWANVFSDVVSVGVDWWADWIHDAAHRYWRVVLTPTGTPSGPAAIGEMLVGLPINFPTPHNWQGFDPDGERPVAYGVQEGPPLVAHVVAYVERSVKLAWNALDESFVEARGSLADFRTWWEEAGSKGVPFVFLWNDRPAVYRQLLWCRASGKATRKFVTPPDYSPPSTSGTYRAQRSLALALTGRRRS